MFERVREFIPKSMNRGASNHRGGVNPKDQEDNDARIIRDKFTLPQVNLARSTIPAHLQSGTLSEEGKAIVVRRKEELDRLISLGKKNSVQNTPSNKESEMAARKTAAKKTASTKLKAKALPATKVAATNGEKPSVKTVGLPVTIEVSAVNADATKVEKLEVEVSGAPTRRPAPVIGAAHGAADYGNPTETVAGNIAPAVGPVLVIDDTMPLDDVSSKLSKSQLDLESKRKMKKSGVSSVLRNLLATVIGGGLIALVSGLVSINLVTLGVMVDFPLLLPVLVSILAGFAGVSYMRHTLWVHGTDGLSTFYSFPGLFLFGVALVTIVHAVYKHPAFGWMSL